MEEKGMSVIPAELKYSKTHEWVKEEDGLFVIGLTDYAQSELGDIVFINLPEEGDEVSVGEAFSDVESVKAVSDVYSPVSGVVAEINEELQDNPALVNEDPYGAWLIKVRDVTEQEELLDAAGYEKVVAEEEA
jgi:glycine cleavage system H protein